MAARNALAEVLSCTVGAVGVVVLPLVDARAGGHNVLAVGVVGPAPLAMFDSLLAIYHTTGTMQIRATAVA